MSEAGFPRTAVELDATTFVLQIVNFLILVWILERFLYEPVRAAIAERRAAIEKRLAEARDVEARAAALEAQYRSRLSDWERELATKRDRLREELEAERERRRVTLNAELEGERQRSAVLMERRRRDLEHEIAEDAMARAAGFVARLLARVASPALEERLIDVFLEDLDDGLRERLRGPNGGPDTVTVRSAHPLGERRRADVAATLGRIVGHDVRCRFLQDPALLAGLQVDVGPWALQANLRDELRFFVEKSARPAGEPVERRGSTEAGGRGSGP